MAKQVNDYTSGHLVTKTWQYIGGFVYCNDTLQYLLHEEGQIRNARKVNSSTGSIYYAFEYDYFIKDHQGNVRTVLTEGSDTATYAATMESKDSVVVAATFSNVYSPANTVNAKPTGFDTDTSNHNVSILNPLTGASVGPSIVLKVMRGDQVQLSTYSFYNTPVQSPQSGINLLGSILSVLGTSVIGANGHLAAGDLTGINNALSPNVTNFLSNGRSYDNSRPKAYLNWILFDDQFNYVAGNSGVAQVSSGSTKQVLAAPTQNISKNGYLYVYVYVYVYVSNESQQNVYFDNLTVRQMTGPLQQEQSYYPFGLPMAGISDKALLKSNTPYKANGGTELEEEAGLQYYNTLFRKYDPQIGRFSGIDALAESTGGSSPYHFAGNNPVLGIDPTGLLVDYHWILYGNDGGSHLQNGGSSYLDNTFSELDQYDFEMGIGSGGPGEGSPSFQNMVTLQRENITPNLAKYVPGVPYLWGPGQIGKAGNDRYGNKVMRVREDMTMDNDALDLFPTELLGKLHLTEDIVRLGSSNFGSSGYACIGGMSMMFGGEGEGESLPFEGHTTTTKFSSSHNLIPTGLGDMIRLKQYEGHVTGKEGEVITIDGSSDNDEFDGSSIVIGSGAYKAGWGYGTDLSTGPVLAFGGYQLQLSVGVGVGLGQFAIDFSHSGSNGEVSGFNFAVRPGAGAAALAVLAVPALVVAL